MHTLRFAVVSFIISTLVAAAAMVAMDRDARYRLAGALQVAPATRVEAQAK
ncbi:hypothetical protein [Methylobacterium nodulans]|uniref:Uncharacterized protein n=1 Tax=Methylobacterium nodulans (strain LMG 21967 / CNCM I-2342 / ORS 2060) TaxID=460265 RepID=B8ICM8_METNO|nr:hypothetical protein [Methylobacterium nodulans]ACL57439.1 hypothetical protein Mnod_2469 [Methylobacterium nodulans ORS 2060]